MQATFTQEDGLRFQRGSKLPTAKYLIRLLNMLGKVQNAGRINVRWRLENKIRLLARPGIYEGYLHVGLRSAIVRVVSVERRGFNANRHSFFVKLEELDGTSVIAEHQMDLADFLSEVNRERLSGGQHIGPRFWPF